MDNLKKSLQINALFSGLSGIALVVAHNPIANLFATENNTVFWIIGLALIVFSLTIIYEVKKLRPIGVKVIIVQDFMWVVGSAILLIFQPFEISTAGYWTIAVVALVVLFMGINQARALAQTGKSN